MLALLVGLVLAAVVLAPWRLVFAIDAYRLYEALYSQAAEEALEGSSGWLATAGYSYQEVQEQNKPRVLWLSRLSGAIGMLMVTQTVLWLLALRLS